MAAQTLCACECCRGQGHYGRKNETQEALLMEDVVRMWMAFEFNCTFHF